MKVLDKVCIYCRSLYRPDPRTAAAQKSCPVPACRLKRKHEAHAKFLKDNPDYFHNRYPQVKTWLSAHPGYLPVYGAAHPEYREKNRRREHLRRLRRKLCPVHIQVTMLRRKARGLMTLQGVDIQDTTRLRLDGILGALAG